MITDWLIAACRDQQAPSWRLRSAGTVEVCDAERANPVMLLLGVAVLWAIAGPTEVAADRGGTTKNRHGRRLRSATIAGVGTDRWLSPEKGRRHGRPNLRLFSFTLYAYLQSPWAPPFAKFLVGHPSWRNDPSHLVVEDGERIQVDERRRRGPYVHTGRGVRRRPRSTAQRGHADCARMHGSSRGASNRSRQAAGRHG